MSNFDDVCDNCGHTGWSHFGFKACPDDNDVGKANLVGKKYTPKNSKIVPIKLSKTISIPSLSKLNDVCGNCSNTLMNHVARFFPVGVHCPNFQGTTFIPKLPDTLKSIPVAKDIDLSRSQDQTTEALKAIKNKQPAINNHTCPSCKNDRVSKEEKSCWKCGSNLHGKNPDNLDVKTCSQCGKKTSEIEMVSFGFGLTLPCCQDCH